MILPVYATKAGKPAPPNPPQMRFHRLHRSGATNRYYLGGLGAGKTHAGAAEFMRLVLSNAEYLQAHGHTGGARYLVGAPTDTLVEAGAWEAVTSWLTEFEALNALSLVDRMWTSPPRRIRLITGDLITFQTVKGGKIAAVNAACAWLDEGELCDNPMSALRGMKQRLRDNRLPEDRRVLLVTSTPWGSHVIHQHFSEQISSKKNRAYGMVHASSRDNPGLPSDYLEGISVAMSAREVAELIDGKPQAADGAVFGLEFDRAESVIDFEWTGPRSDCEYYVAIDWGGSYHALFIEHDPIDPDTGRECRLGGVDVVFDELVLDKVQLEKFLDEVMKRMDELRITKRFKAAYSDYNPVEAVEIGNGHRYFDKRLYADRINDTRDKEEGISTTRWRLADATGRRRLLFARRLEETNSNRGILRCMEGYARLPTVVDGIKVFTSGVRQDSPYSHGPDALRAYCWPRYRHLRIHDARRRARA